MCYNNLAENLQNRFFNIIYAPVAEPAVFNRAPPVAESSEGRKGAAVEILHRLEVQKISGTARVTRKRGCSKN